MSKRSQPSVLAAVHPSVPAAPPAAAALSAAARALGEAALAPRTLAIYRRELGALEAWLGERGRPWDDAAIADYCADRFEAGGAAPATIALAVAAVKTTARLAGLPSPVGGLTARVMAGIRREGRVRGRGQVDPIRWEQADAAAALAAGNGRSLRGLRDAALVALASDCLLRISELIAVQVGDLAAEKDGSARLTIRSSKTDQEGAGAELYVGRPTMRRINSWRRAARVDSGALFRRIRRGAAVQLNGLSVSAARRIIQARAAAAGIEGRVSGHSPRVGAAQSLAAAGAGLVELQQAGRWDSPTMPAHYARGQLAGRGAVARLRHGAGA